MLGAIQLHTGPVLALSGTQGRYALADLGPLVLACLGLDFLRVLLRGRARILVLLSCWVLAGLWPAGRALADGLEWRNEPGFRWAELPALPPAKPGFTLLPAHATGLSFTNVLDELAGAANRVLYNGAGVAVGDFDNDGWPDIFLCSLSGTNALFRNLGGWHFQEVTQQAGLGAPLPMTRGAVFADIDGDGNLDLLISVNGRGVVCFKNTGQGRFLDVTPAAGTASTAGSTTLTLADVDGNGTLDLYIANYRPDDVRDRGRVNMRIVNGRPILPGTETNRFVMLNGRLEECGQADQLLLNDGSGKFRAQSWTNGVFLDEAGRNLTEPPLDWGLTAAFRDLNGDLAPDLYVCNDYWTPDRLWINDGHGHFRATDRLSLRKTSASSMSVDFADINRDGLVDFFVVDMLSRDPRLRKRQSFAQMPAATPVGVIDDRPQVMRNTLFLNRGDGTFAEIACFANLPASDWSWSPMFLDVDLDGYEDLLIGAGHFRDVQDYDAEQQVRSRQHSWDGYRQEAERQKAFTRELMEHFRLYPLLQMPVGAFRNLGNCRFTETTEAWGLNQPGVHQGLALADFDQDGDLDLVVNNLNSPAMLFRNESSAGRVAVRLKGNAPNTQGIGAKISLLGGAVVAQTAEVTCGGHYLSGSDTTVCFAAGSNAGGMTIEVRWRGGSRCLIPAVQRNRIYEVHEAASAPAPAEVAQAEMPLFEDASDRIRYRHHEQEYNDYERQPLLPFKLSQLGPGVAWFDVDGDGHDDLVLGNGRGGIPAVFRIDAPGRFAPGDTNQMQALPNDAAGVLGWDNGAGARTVLCGLTGYETAGSHAGLALTWSGRGLGAGVPLAGEISSGGAVAVGGLQGGGRLVLFVAGGVSPGAYPAGAPSKLYRLEGRRWKLDSKNSAVLENLGIVNGAVWSDLDGDGLPELILACEWGPIRVFRSRGGALFEITDELKLGPYTGWWRGVTTGDLDGDGRLDIIASNWGLNSPYRASPEKPLTFLYGQIAQPGTVDIIETEYVGGTLAPRRQFMPLANAMPFLFDRFASHQAFSEASVEGFLGERIGLCRKVTATTLTSMVFLNTGHGFKPMELPREAQFAPAFSVNVADFDGDGNEDVFLSQNFFDTQPEHARMDAGLGLLLKGDGRGGLAAVPPSQSGIRVFGEQRGAAVGDFDEDGRPDLVVTQNGAALRLFRNVGAAPGLRVKLNGLPGNPAGVGAVLRLQFKEREGPAREIHAGSGYWSQDSATQVLAIPTKPEALHVRWPGGRVTSTPIPANCREIVVNTEGKLVSSR